MTKSVVRYLSGVPNGKLVLWCYLIWWSNTVVHHFDASPSIWLNSLGISVVIGVALMLSIGGLHLAAKDKWQTFRLFAMPFCVSSFSSLIKGQHFIFIFPPSVREAAIGIGIAEALDEIGLLVSEQFGAVSRETVLEMVSGALVNSGAGIAVAVTGIAGPGGGSPDKPVGSVWIGWKRRGGYAQAQLFHFHGDRDAIRRQTVSAALNGLLAQL